MIDRSSFFFIKKNLYPKSLFTICPASAATLVGEQLGVYLVLIGQIFHSTYFARKPGLCAVKIAFGYVQVIGERQTKLLGVPFHLGQYGRRDPTAM